MTWYVVCGIHINMERLLLVSAKQQVVDVLTKEIVSGNLKPCQPLYERDLAERLGVSRTPIREALQVLASAGFIETKSRVGWSVSIPDVKSIREILELRMILETAGVETILNGNNEPLRESVSTLFDPFTLDNIDRDIEQYLKIDDQFHKSLIEATDNKRMIDMYANLALWIDWVRHFISYESSRSRSLREHKEICEGLKNKDLKATQDRLKTHIKRVRNEFTLHLTSKGGETAPTALK